jgi:peptidoglycan/xylan/chitin deacetylase (PgdA/CDA1 family)
MKGAFFVGYNSPMMPVRVHKFAPLLLAVVLLGVASVLWTLNPNRKIPIRKVFNPIEWVRHWQGRDHYDSQQALLQEGDPGVKEVALTNHTYNHQDLPALKPHEIANELRLCDQDIWAATGRHTTLMRPPGVQYNDKVLDVAKSLGYVTVSWTVGAKDYETGTTADFIQERVLHRTAPGSIILLHQDTPATIAALPAIIDGLRAQGYTFVTISQMLERLGVHR